MAAAVLIRNAIDEDDDATGDTDTTSVVICDDSLIDQCQALGDDVEVRAEAAATTASTLADGTIAEDVDAWITTTAWLEVVDSRSPDALGDAEALATSPAVVATAPGRHDAITDLCGGDDVWSCLGDNAGTSWADLGDGSNAEWRELKVGLTDPDSAVGLSGLASVAAGFFGNTTFAANDPAFGEFEGWLANLAEPSAAGDPNPAETLATRPGTYSAAGSIAAIADDFAARGRRGDRPDPEVAATVAIVGIGEGVHPRCGPRARRAHGRGMGDGHRGRPRPYAEAGRDGRPPLALEGSDQLMSRGSHRSLAVALVALGLVAAACSSAGLRRRGRVRPRRPRRLHPRRPVGVAREARPPHRPRRRLQRERRRRARRPVRLRPGAVQVIRGRGPAPRHRVGREHRGPATGDLVAGGVDVGGGARSAARGPG